MILIASPVPETRNYFSECLESMGLVVTVADYFTALTAVAKLRPKLIFIDIDLFDFEGAAQVVTISERSPATRIIVVGGHVSMQRQVELYLAGVRGYCNRTIKAQQLKKLAEVVCSGEVWFSRAQMSHLLGCLNQTRTDAYDVPEKSQLCLSGLTRREKEIAILVGNGKNNRQISQTLRISETTVKSHLSTVFRKLGINDRLSLALQISMVIQSPQNKAVDGSRHQNDLLHSA